MKINKECGKRLRECFEASNFKTQQELAGATGFSSVYISNIMTGKKPMTVTAAKTFSETFGVLEDYLLCKTNCKTEKERTENFYTAITDMEECIARFSGYNGLHIKKCILETDKGETLTKLNRIGLTHFNKKKLLGKRMIDGEEYNIIDIKFEIEIYDKTYIVDAEHIFECFNFITNYLQMQRSRLYHELEKKDKFLDIDDRK